MNAETLLERARGGLLGALIIGVVIWSVSAMWGLGHFDVYAKSTLTLCGFHIACRAWLRGFSWIEKWAEQEVDDE